MRRVVLTSFAVCGPDSSARENLNGDSSTFGLRAFGEVEAPLLKLEPRHFPEDAVANLVPQVTIRQEEEHVGKRAVSLCGHDPPRANTVDGLDNGDNVLPCVQGFSHVVIVLEGSLTIGVEP